MYFPFSQIQSEQSLIFSLWRVLCNTLYIGSQEEIEGKFFFENANPSEIQVNGLFNLAAQQEGSSKELQLPTVQGFPPLESSSSVNHVERQKGTVTGYSLLEADKFQ